MIGDAQQAELLLAELGYPLGDSEALERCELLLSAQRVHTRVAAEASELLGLVSGQFVDMFPCRMLFITILVVKKEARKRGVARALVAALEDFGRENGCAQAMGVVRSDLPVNHQVFESFGYENAGIRFLRRLTGG